MHHVRACWPVHFVGAKFCQGLVSRYKTRFCRSRLWRVCWQHEGLNEISQIPVHLAEDCLGSMVALAQGAVSPSCLAGGYRHLPKSSGMEVPATGTATLFGFAGPP